jgi:hypothetical protein
MQKILLGTAIAALVTTAAQAAPLTWIGIMTITSRTPGCDASDPAKAFLIPHQYFVANFRPKIAAADPMMGLSFFTERSGFLIIAKTNANNGQYSGYSLTSRSTIDQNTSSYNLTFNPTTMSPATKSVDISGTITNFFGFPNCTIGVQGTLGKRND